MLIDIALLHGFSSNFRTELNEKTKHPGVHIQFKEKLFSEYSFNTKNKC